jgi:DNA polymerase-3 subunit delta
VSIHVVRGDDPILRDEVVRSLVEKLVGADDRTLAVEEITVPGRSGTNGEGGASAEGREAAVAAVVNAASSPPLMTGCRVVVVREAANLTTADVSALVAYLAQPVETTHLVVVAGGGRLPELLARALKDAGATEHGPVATATADVLARALDHAGLTLTPGALRAVVERLGDDAGRVPALVATLSATFGRASRLSESDVEPYLGEAGAVPTYQLTNAIEAGDTAAALAVLHRLLHAVGTQQSKPLHPLQVLTTLHHYVRRLARLDDPAVRDVPLAIVALGGRVKPYPARKALETSRRMGTEGLRRAYEALATADRDLKGARAIPEAAVLELLVARLAALCGPRPGRARRGR